CASIRCPLRGRGTFSSSTTTMRSAASTTISGASWRCRCMTSGNDRTDASGPGPGRTRLKRLLASALDPERTLSLQLGRLLVAAAVIGFWEWGSGRLFESFYFSKPSLIARQFLVELGDPGFYRDLGITALQMVLGYGIGAATGIALGVL